MRTGPGRRVFTASFLPATLLATAVLTGCEAPLPTAPTIVQLDELRFHGGLVVLESFPVQLGFRLVARNVTDHDVRLVTDGCGLGARAYRTPDRTGTPAWNGRPAGPCPASAVPLPVAARDSLVWRRDYSAADVLGDSLPDGRYFFTATLGRASLVNSENVRRVEVTAGDARLAVPR